MPMNKPHLEFQRVDMAEGWATPAGYPAGIQQKILASDLDETRKMGSRTRLLRFEPGTYTTAPFVHDHWEEVYLVSGDLIVGNDAAGKGGEAFEAPTYACRPPGVHHGPFKSDARLHALRNPLLRREQEIAPKPGRPHGKLTTSAC